MATFNKFDCFVENLAEGVHKLDTNQLVVALTNTLPVSTNTTLTNITEIAYTNFVNGTTTGRNLSLVATSPSTQTAGVYKLILQDLVLTGQTATTPAFRYVVIYNSQGTGITNPLIGWYDYGASITLNVGETLTLDFDQVGGVLTLT